MNISSLLRAVVSETLASLLLSFLMPHTSPGSTNIVVSPLGFVFCSCPALTPSLYLFNRYLCRVWPYAKQGSKCFIYINSFISHTKHMWQVQIRKLWSYPFHEWENEADGSGIPSGIRQCCSKVYVIFPLNFINLTFYWRLRQFFTKHFLCTRHFTCGIPSNLQENT